MNRVILPDVELCAIVRDELINPAGGIEDFVRSTAPFVGRMTIVDTGSKDGTREKLRGLQKGYPSLNIAEYDSSMRDAYLFVDPRVMMAGILKPEEMLADTPNRFSYAAARNYAVSLTQSKWLLVLDADERLTPDDFGRIARLRRQHPHARGFNFDFRNIYLGGKDEVIKAESRSALNPRLYAKNPDIVFIDGWPQRGETLRDISSENMFKAGLKIEKVCINVGVEIKHFKSTKQAQEQFSTEWRASKLGKSPADLPSFSQVRRVNPKRKEYS